MIFMDHIQEIYKKKKEEKEGEKEKYYPAKNLIPISEVSLPWNN